MGVYKLPQRFTGDVVFDRLIENLLRLRRDEVLLEGDIYFMYDEVCYEFNMMNRDRKADLDELFKYLYGGVK